MPSLPRKGTSIPTFPGLLEQSSRFGVVSIIDDEVRVVLLYALQHG